MVGGLSKNLVKPWAYQFLPNLSFETIKSYGWVGGLCDYRASSLALVKSLTIYYLPKYLNYSKYS